MKIIKKLAYIIFLLFVLYSCKTKGLKIDNKSSIVREYYHGGELKSECSVINDSIKSGIERTYYPNGELMFEITYQNNIKNGVQKEYYENGELNSIGWNKNGLPDSILLMYYKNGSIKGKVNYRKGKLFGESIYYESNGKVQNYSFFNPLGKCCYRREYNDSGIVLKEEGTPIAFFVFNDNKLNVGDTFNLRIFIASPLDVKQKLSLKLYRFNSLINEMIIEVKNNIGYYTSNFDIDGDYKLLVNLESLELSNQEIKYYEEDIPIYIYSNIDK